MKGAKMWCLVCKTGRMLYRLTMSQSTIYRDRESYSWGHSYSEKPYHIYMNMRWGDFFLIHHLKQGGGERFLIIMHKVVYRYFPEYQSWWWGGLLICRVIWYSHKYSTNMGTYFNHYEATDTIFPGAVSLHMCAKVQTCSRGNLHGVI